MKVALFTSNHTLDSHDTTHLVTRLLSHLANRHSSVLFAPTLSSWRYAQTRVVPAAHWSIPFVPGRSIRPWGVNPTRELGDYAPDVCHVIDPLGRDGLAMRYARRTGTSLIITLTDQGLDTLLHSQWPWRRVERTQTLRWMRQADLVICHSQVCRTFLQNCGISQVEVLPQAIDTEVYSPAKRSEAWRSLFTHGVPREPILLYAGPLDDDPRLDWLRSVLTGLPNAHLAVAGKGPRLLRWKTAFAGTRATFLGDMGNENLAHAMASSDLLVLPSFKPNQTSMVLKAIASGLPIVGPRDGALCGHVISDQNGYLFEPNNPADLVIRVLQAIAHPERLLRLSSQARQAAMQHAWPCVLDQVLAQYDLVVSQKASDNEGHSEIAQPRETHNEHLRIEKTLSDSMGASWTNL